jgi:hypothetical protein
MAVDGLIHNAAPAPAPPKGACGRSLCACGHSVGRVVQRRPLTSGRHEHTEQLGVSRWKPSQEASGGASGGRCEEVMRMRKPQPKHGRRARAAVLGGSPCGRHQKRRPCTCTGTSSRRLAGGTRTAAPGRSTCGSLPRFRSIGVMRMKKPQSMHGCRAWAAVFGGSPCGRDESEMRRPFAGGDPAARLSSAARPWIATRTGASSRRLTAGTRTVRPGQTTCRSLPRSGPHSNTQRGGSRRAFQSRNAPGNYHAEPGGRETATRTT